MKPPESILRRLMQSLAIVSAIGMFLMLVFIWVEYQISVLHIFDLTQLRQSAHELLEHVVLPMILLSIPMAFAGRWAIRRGVRPLTEAAEHINAASDQPRGVRVDTSTLPIETVPFADAVNHLLDRVDHAAAMHEAFAADIAHELRTPLTLLSLQLDTLDDPKAAAMRADINAMRRLIDQLMLLAQIDAQDAASIPPHIVDLVDVAGDVAAQMAPAALADDKRIELCGAQSGTIWGRREAVAAALRNLVENALRVTPSGKAVVIYADAAAELAVRDGGPGLTQARYDMLSKRLRRCDHASRDGAGLGLSIVSRIMASHGGRVAADADIRELRLIFHKK